MFKENRKKFFGVILSLSIFGIYDGTAADDDPAAPVAVAGAGAVPMAALEGPAEPDGPEGPISGQRLGDGMSRFIVGFTRKSFFSCCDHPYLVLERFHDGKFDLIGIHFKYCDDEKRYKVFVEDANIVQVKFRGVIGGNGVDRLPPAYRAEYSITRTDGWTTWNRIHRAVFGYRDGDRAVPGDNSRTFDYSRFGKSWLSSTPTYNCCSYIEDLLMRGEININPREDKCSSCTGPKDDPLVRDGTFLRRILFNFGAERILDAPTAAAAGAGR